MTRRSAIPAAGLTAALTVCALGASGASAITLHACEENAAGATAQEYTSGTCETKGAGEFRTVPVAAGTLTTPTPVTSQVITGTVAGLAVEIECKGMGGSGKSENFTVGEMKFGVVKALKIKYFECTVLKPKGGGCVIKGEPPIETVELFLVTFLEEGTIRTAMFPEAGEVIATFVLEGCKPPGLNGPRSLKGEIRGFTAADPSLIEFPEGAGTALTLSGSPATYTGDTRLFMEGTTKRLAFELP